MFRQLIGFLLLVTISCTTNQKTETPSVVKPIGGFLPGRLVVIQGPTSSTETLINVMVPRLKNYEYEIVDETGLSSIAEKYETVQIPTVFYKVEKVYAKNLQPNKKYTVKIVDTFRGHKTTVDQRSFQTLDVKKNTVRFATLSCMADDWKFEQVINPMWERLRTVNPEMIVLNGDIVYVDSFDFVERQKATEYDLWQRYIDALGRLPVFHWQELKPIFATWDDHDFGTNDGDRNFVSKKQAQKIFRAFFGGKDLSDGIWKSGPGGVTSRFSGFNQKIYLMDDRTYRQPNKDQKKKELYGHWGEQQHQWLMNSLKDSKSPAWIFNGNQVFNGKHMDFKEAFEANHGVHFLKFIDEVRSLPTPVVFASGDIHFSEIMRVPKEKLGYETYELTSSAMHSYQGDGWPNPMRIPEAFTREFNFLLVDSLSENNQLQLHVQSLGLSPKPYFVIDLKVKK